MREERGNIGGGMVINEPLTLWGSIAGDVSAVDGSKFYMRGAIYGNLDVEAGGRVHVFGNISGNLTVKPKAKVILSGTIGGDVVNLGGRLNIDAQGVVHGKVKQTAGDTTIDSHAKLMKG